VDTGSDVGQVSNLRPISNRPADGANSFTPRVALPDDAQPLTHLVDELGALEGWLALSLSPRDWAARFRTLRNLLEQAPLPVSSHEIALEWRARAAALDLFDEALEEAAEALSARPTTEPRPVPGQPQPPKPRELRERAPNPNLRIFAPGPWPMDPDERDPSVMPDEPTPRKRTAPNAREQSALPFPTFWRAVKSVLRLKPLRLDDRRRNVVHVLSAPEARQWVLPVVFVCGMVEKDFPQFHRQDPFFPDAARCSLNAKGIRVRTAAEFEREERALFDSAITRATLLVTLSYPEFNSRGDRNLPSIFLEDLILPTQEFRAVRPRPRHAPSVPGPAEIRTPAHLDFLRQKTATVSPSALESYMQCPFQYFGSRVLRLKPAPVRPEERLDFLTQGNIVHAVLAAWWAKRHDLEALFQQIFEDALREKKIPPGYHTERLRNAMVEDLQTFAAADRWPRDAFESHMEEKFQFPLDDSVQVSGKIDRLDVTSGGIAYVIDYKYSGAQRTKERLKNENLVQAPLYLMAAQRLYNVNPAGMFYIGLKGGIVYAGWKDQPSRTGLPALGPRLVSPQTATSGPAPIPYDGDPFPPGWLEHAGERTLQVVEKIRNGRIEVAPADTDNCRFCDCRDVCRVETVVTQQSGTDDSLSSSTGTA
jgi:RecB family exonuclease